VDSCVADQTFCEQQGTNGFCNGAACPPTQTPTNTPTDTPTGYANPNTHQHTYKHPKQHADQHPDEHADSHPDQHRHSSGRRMLHAACSTGFCVDSICCDTACTDSAMRCNLAGQVGTCASTAAEAPALTPWGLVVAALLLTGVAGFALQIGCGDTSTVAPTQPAHVSSLPPFSGMGCCSRCGVRTRFGSTSTAIAPK
jgi:hypothetical protein